MTQPSKKDRVQNSGNQLYQRAKKLIPGGTQLFGKRQEMFAPDQWPTYFSEAQGAEVIDLDGRCYVDMSACGIGATVLGYADPDVTAAVVQRVQKGGMCTLNPPDEVELAELLIQLHPWAEMARFGRVGGETMAVAVRIARARTRRDKVAFCGYHGWHDWYLAANLPTEGDEPAEGEEMVDRLGNWHLLPGLEPRGIPRGLAGTSFPFTYNRIDELKSIVQQHGKELAAIVMEPTRQQPPEPGFLEGVRELADHCGAKLIFDEITIGWKLCCGGAHLKYGVDPDLVVFAKTLGNGHPITAVIGRADTMQAAQDTFISSALWTEAIGPAAGVATVKKLMQVDVPSHIDRIGQRVRDGLYSIAEGYKVPFIASGYPGLQFFSFDSPQANEIQTLWTVRMLEHGFLVSGGFFPMLSHENQHVDDFLEACDPVFEEIGIGLRRDDLQQRIGGPVKHAGFRRLA